MTGGKGRRPAILIWLDAHATLDELGEDEITGQHKPSRIETVGYILISDETGVSIAGEWLPASNGGDETYRSITFVPRGMVLEERMSRRKKKPAESAPRDP